MPLMKSIARRALAGLLLAVAAIAVATAATLGAASLVHIILIAVIGQEGISARDHSLPMLALLVGCYGVGALAGLTTLLVGYRRFVRNRPSSDIRAR
jgi:hypothetical protein